MVRKECLGKRLKFPRLQTVAMWYHVLIMSELWSCIKREILYCHFRKLHASPLPLAREQKQSSRIPSSIPIDRLIGVRILKSDTRLYKIEPFL